MSLQDVVIHEHGGRVLVVRGYAVNGSPDLLAIGGTHSVQVLSCVSFGTTLIAQFYVGVAITAIAWSPRSSSPIVTQDYLLELVVAGADGNLRHLSKSRNHEECITNITAPLTGHTSKVNGLTFCGDPNSEMGWRYVASVGDDRLLLIWDLYPTQGFEEKARVSPASPRPSSEVTAPSPAAWSLLLPYPLHTVLAHPENAKEIIVSDDHGSVFVVDWRSDEFLSRDGTLGPRKRIVSEYIDPLTLARGLTSQLNAWSGSASWRSDINIIGACFGDRWVVWDQIRGQKPIMTGTSFVGGSGRFRWCPTKPNFFAISSLSSAHGASINIHDIDELHAPLTIPVRPSPHVISDFDWVGQSNDEYPRIAAACGHAVYIGQIAHVRS